MDSSSITPSSLPELFDRIVQTDRSGSSPNRWPSFEFQSELLWPRPFDTVIVGFAAS